MTDTTDSRQLRKLVYALLITVAAGSVAGRIVAVERVYEPSLRWPDDQPRPMPTFSSNDRSRWATVKALVDGETPKPGDEGTYVVGRRDKQNVLQSIATPLAAHNPLSAATFAEFGYLVRTEHSDSGIIFQDGYQSVDKVLDPDTLKFYSTKPPLLPTLIAGLYWLLQTITGWTLADQVAPVVRTILLAINWLPLLIYLGLLARLIDRFGKSNWGRFFVMAAACFGTYLSTFAITVNNHSIATYSALFALYAAITILERLTGAASSNDRRPTSAPWYLYAVSGLFAAFTACNELPALSLTVALFVILLRWSPKPTLLFFLPFALLPIAGYFYTNYEALGRWTPVQTDFGGPWYQYEGSHWEKPAPGEVRTGIDWARYHETRLQYAFHLLLGHHGLLSLTPIWLLAFIGMLLFRFSHLRYWLLGGPSSPSTDPPDAARARIQSLIASLTLTLTLVVIAFYLVRSDNYGGWTSGPRWLFWLTPLWLLTLLPVADWLGKSRIGRGVAYILLAFSVFSVSYPAWNPWRHPWIFNLMKSLGWPGY